MASRKPPGMQWESWIDKVISEGRERGEFDGLAGAGKPLPDLDKPHDEMRWVRSKLEREGVSYLPPTLALRKDREDTLARLEAESSEARARQLLEELNGRIRAINSRSIDGPPSTVMPVDVEAVIAEWREARQVRAPGAAEALPPENGAEGESEATPRRWRLRRRGR